MYILQKKLILHNKIKIAFRQPIPNTIGRLLFYVKLACFINLANFVKLFDFEINNKLRYDKEI